MDHFGLVFAMSVQSGLEQEYWQGYRLGTQLVKAQSHSVFNHGRSNLYSSAGIS